MADGSSASYQAEDLKKGELISGLTLPAPQYLKDSTVSTKRETDHTLSSVPVPFEHGAWTKPSPTSAVGVEISSRSPEQAEPSLYDSEKAELKEDNKKLGEENTELKAKVNNLENENTELKEVNKKLVDETTVLKTRNEALEKDYVEIRKSAEDMRETLACFQRNHHADIKNCLIILQVIFFMRIDQLLKIFKVYYHNRVRKVQLQINEMHTGEIFCPLCWTNLPCSECNHFFRDHGAASNHDCRCCSKKENHQHPRVKPIWSHVFAENWLKVVCHSNCDRVIFDAKTHAKLTPRECSWKLLCRTHDAATGDMEKKLRERLQDMYYADWEDGESEILQVDADILRIITYRGLLVNVNIRHYEECGECARYYGSITRFLECAHDCSSKYSVKFSEENQEKLKVEQAEMLFHFKDSLNEAEAEYYIEFPFVCTVNLSDVDPSLSCCPMIYAQFPQLGCFWAFPLYPVQTTKLQPHFTDVIKRINTELKKEHDKFFETKDAEKWRKKLETAEEKRVQEGKLPTKPKLKPKLIIRYLPKCCLKVAKYPAAISES